jgi:hypothetical protein
MNQLVWLDEYRSRDAIQQTLSTSGDCLLRDSIQFGFVLYCYYEF